MGRRQIIVARQSVWVNMGKARRIVYVVAGPLVALSPLAFEMPQAAWWIMPAMGLVLLVQGLSGY